MSDILKNYKKLVEEGCSQRTACKMLGIPRTTMQGILARSGEVVNKRTPKVLFWDVENAPSVGVSFSRWKVNLSPDHIVSEGGWLISACYKWGGESEIHSLVLTPEEAIMKDDSRIVASLYEVFEEADIVVGQNGDRFDIPLFKTRLIKHHMPPHKTVKTVDTLKIAKQLKFNSNKLDSLAKEMGIGRKVQHSGIDLWIRCMMGEQEALDEMVEYNIQDVDLLEQVYTRLKAFDSKHPNVSHFYDDDLVRCPVCGGTDVQPTGNSIFTPVSEFSEMVCGDCGHRSRTRKSINTKEKRENILISPKLTG